MIFRGIGSLFSFEGFHQKDGRRVTEADIQPITKAAMVTEKGRIHWVGPEKKIPKEFAKKKLKEVDLGGQNVLPGFVECHTHLVFAGHRAAEFEWRQQGVSYQEIAARGGGILSTMTKTRKAKKEDLLLQAQKRAEDFIAQGVTTLEVKSGYALNLKDEMKCLEVAHGLRGVRIVPTFLGAHARPPEFKTNEGYLKELTEKYLPLVKRRGLSSRIDIFYEKGFFEGDSARAYLKAARDLGFDVLLHADQLHESGGSDVGLDVDAISVDHAIRLSAATIRRLGQSPTTAVLLPAADLYLKCPYPKARELIEAGARVALATDFNPGTSPTQDLALVGLLARLEMKMSLPEVLSAYSIGAAAALGLADETGSLTVGKSADFFTMEAELEELFYSPGRRLVKTSYLAGRKVFH